MKGWYFSFLYISTFLHKITYAQFGSFSETHGSDNKELPKIKPSPCPSSTPVASIEAILYKYHVILINSNIIFV